MEYSTVLGTELSSSRTLASRSEDTRSTISPGSGGIPTLWARMEAHTYRRTIFEQHRTRTNANAKCEARHGPESRRATTRSACAPLLASTLARSVGGEYIASTRVRFWECGVRKFGDVGYAAQASGGGLGTAGHRAWVLGRGNEPSFASIGHGFRCLLLLLAYSRTGGIACCRRSGC